MKVVLFGATGMIGSRILEELLGRGHVVNAVVRHPEKVPVLEGVTAMQGDVTDGHSVAATAAGCDAAISAYSPPRTEPGRLVAAARALVGGLPAAGVRRLIVVGSAGTLEVFRGVLQLDTPEFPPNWLGISLAHRDVLPVLRKSDLDWTFFCPSSIIQPGQRTGKFRLGGTHMISGVHGESRISVEDYAMALVNELEQPRCLGQQCTVGY
jgi:putative NADH-flavin reductase